MVFSNDNKNANYKYNSIENCVNNDNNNTTKQKYLGDMERTDFAVVTLRFHHGNFSMENRPPQTCTYIVQMRFEGVK